MEVLQQLIGGARGPRSHRTLFIIIRFLGMQGKKKESVSLSFFLKNEHSSFIGTTCAYIISSSSYIHALLISLLFNRFKDRYY